MISVVPRGIQINILYQLLYISVEREKFFISSYFLESKKLHSGIKLRWPKFHSEISTAIGFYCSGGNKGVDMGIPSPEPGKK